jgi:D-cysteine desulfhydrase
VDCYKEIKQYEQENNTFFDYIFFASGTGTTQAGLVCGQILEKDEKKIVGISIARKNPRGRDIIIDSIREYLTEHKCEVIEDDIQNRTIFVDDYIGNGYGRENREIEETIKKSMIQYGIPLDSTYTGKAFWGMKQYIQNKQIKGKNILFIHTGGTPLFFDDLGRMAEE